MDLKSLNPHQLSYRYLNPKKNYFHYQQKNTQKKLISLKKPTPFHIHLRPKPTRLPPEKTKNVTTSSDILRLMDNLNITIPKDIYISLIKECTYGKDLNEARELFHHVIRSGVYSDLSFVNRILLMLVSCGLVDEARKMFDRMKVKDSNSWASMAGCYMGSGDYEEMINLFVEMDFRQWLEDDSDFNVPFSWIIVCVLKACVEMESFVLGRQIHGLVVKFGYEDNLFLCSSLMNFYGKSRCLEGLNCVFKHLGNRNTAIWTSKLVNNCREHRFREAIDVFKEMGREGVKKNEFTFSSVLRACSRIEDEGLCGRQVHANLIKLGFDSNDFVQCGLVNMYAKCGLIEYAEKAFLTIGGEITMGCWNAMLMGYIQHGYGIDAIKILYAMKSIGLHPQESLINKVELTCGSRVIERKMNYLL